MRIPLVLGVCGLYMATMAQPMRIPLKLILEGPYDVIGGKMHDSLRTAGVLPTIEPYSDLGYVHVGGGGGEQVDPDVFNVLGNDAIVDWVVIELRDAMFNGFRVDTRSALLQRDGDVVDMDGASAVEFIAPGGTYFLSVKHRNHLGVMTATALDFDGNSPILDFTDPATLTWGWEARKQIGSRLVLWCGDSNGNGQIKYAGVANDRDVILQAVGGATPNNALTGYVRSDVNLDAHIKYTGLYNDRDPILVNVGGSTPNNVRTAQVP